MKTLLLIDGSSYLYRAFHALPDLRNRLNEPTGAIYGVLNMLRRLHQDYTADYSACVFDAKGKTFRDDWYPEYKANRAIMPSDLSLQIEPIHEAIRAMGWPIVILDGVEADDVIGTMVYLAKRENIQTIISTGDKDMAQLVNPQVTLINTMTNEKLDEAGVMAKFGIPPERIVDYLTLVGDSVDNIPGVDKVGPKTAVKLLTEYKTLDNLIAHAAEVPGTVGENLRKSLDWLPQARRLLTIKCDIELPLDWHTLTHQAPDIPKLAELYTRFEFKKWFAELEQPCEETVDAPYQPSAEYALILTEQELKSCIETLNATDLISINVETLGVDPLRARLIGLSLATVADSGYYIPFEHQYTGAPQQLPLEMAFGYLKPILEDSAKKKIGHDLKFAKHVFANMGIVLNGIAHDTLLESYVFESHKPHELASMALRHLGVNVRDRSELTGKGAKQIGYHEVAIELACPCSADCADKLLQIHKSVFPKIESDKSLIEIYQNIEMPLLSVLYTIERNGVLLDAALLNQQDQELAKKMSELERLAHELAGQPFNVNSPKQIQEILFTQLKLPITKRTPGGAPSTDEEVLAQLALDYPLPKVILEYRGVSKLKSTYTEKLPRMLNPKTGRVHTTYNQAVAVTGRLASSDPNLQNIPVRTGEGRRIREAFIAPPGSQIVSADYSQIELRIMAHLSGDENLRRAFAQEQDVHRATAAEIFALTPEQVSSEQRRYAKVINFGLIYGMSAFGLAGNLGVDRASAQAYMDRYFARYPGVANYMQRTRESARHNGFVETVFGRRLWLTEINSSNGMRRQGAERAAINAPMQGTAADLIKLAMIAVQKWLVEQQLKTMLIMQVHDELVLEVPDDEWPVIKESLPRLMCGVANLDVPLHVDMGRASNWEKAH